jgi:spore maturation protein CgeB
MRIFIPALFYEDSFVDNVQDTLGRMGHEVCTLGAVAHRTYWSLPRYAMRAALSKVLGERPAPIERKIVKVAQSFKPDLILGLTAHLHPETMGALGKLCPGRLILWWGDPPANSKRWELLDPAWDAVFLKDRVTVAKLRIVGREAYLLHEAMNPFWHKPLASQANGLVCVAGNYYAFRQAIVLKLMGDGVEFALYGPRPPRWADERIKTSHTGRYVMREEKSRAFGEAMACLNTFPLAEGDSLNCRAFEVAGTGGLQLIEYRPAVEECFEPGKELLTFSTYEELYGQVERARAEPREMERIRLAGAKRALAEHTYEHRLTQMLRVVAGTAG